MMRRMNQRHTPLDDVVPEGRSARGAGLIAKRAGKTFLHEDFLPTPEPYFGFPGPPPDLVRADVLGREQHVFRSPRMFLPDDAAFEEGHKLSPIRRGECDRYYPCTSHALGRWSATGNNKNSQLSDFIHQEPWL